MSVATRIVIVLVTLWIVFYLAVYFILLSPGSDDDDASPTTLEHKVLEIAVKQHSSMGTHFHNDAFGSQSCKSRDYAVLAKGHFATVIIPARNEEKADVLATVNVANLLHD